MTTEEQNIFNKYTDSFLDYKDDVINGIQQKHFAQLNEELKTHYQEKVKSTLAPVSLGEQSVTAVCPQCGCDERLTATTVDNGLCVCVKRQTEN